MERVWEIKIPIWNDGSSSRDDAEIHEFRAFEESEDRARLRGQMKAVTLFPPNEGWAYDFENMSVREISHEEMGERLETIRAENEEKSKDRLDDAVAEFEKSTGIKLKRG